MIHISGKTATSYLTNVKEQDIQPNAVDLRVDKIFLLFYKPFILSEEKKEHRGSVELGTDQDGFWRLEPGVYEIVMENIIKLGPDEAGWVITRSTLIRNGLFIVSGLYDASYHGSMIASLHVTGGPAYIKKGTRVGQFLLFKSETLKQYDGSYGFNKDGSAKPEELKYHNKG